MKKILLIICLFICIPVSAKTIYSTYSDVSPWQEEVIEGSDTIKVETKKFYKYYNKATIYGSYCISNECGDYNLVDYDKKNYGEWSSWQEEAIATDLNVDVETKDAYRYISAQGVRYIYFKNIHGSNSKLYITDMYINYDNTTIIPKISECSGCSATMYPYAFNGVTNDSMSYINNDGYMTLDLGKELDINKLSIVMWVYDNSGEEKYFDIFLSSGSYDTSFAHYHYSSTLANTSFNDISPTFFLGELFTPIKDKIVYSSPKTSQEPVKENIYNKVYNIKLYRERIIKYLHYKETINYSDYQEDKSVEYPNIDETQYKEMYRYTRRHYVTIMDNIVITNPLQNLNDYIHSDMLYELSSKLNYSLNGTYDVKLTNSFTTTSFKVSMDISANRVKDAQINANSSTISKLMAELETLKATNGYLNNQIDLNKSTQEEISKKYENELERKDNQITNLTDNSVESVSVETASLGVNNKVYIGIAVFIAAILLASYIYFRK